MKSVFDNDITDRLNRGVNLATPDQWKQPPNTAGLTFITTPTNDAQRRSKKLFCEMLDTLKRAKEELRLIRMKDSDAVYDIMLRTDMDLTISAAEGKDTHRARGGYTGGV